MRKSSIAIVGATGAVGAELLKLLVERSFPIENLRLLASPRSAGKTIEFKGEQITIERLAEDVFSGVDVVFFCAGGSVSEEWAPKAAAQGALVIDNTSAFRMHEGIPLVVPEVNPECIPASGIVANPNCSTILLALVLNPLREMAGLKRIVVSTYQAVSGAGLKGMEELENQVRDHGAGKTMTAHVLPVASGAKHYPVAFNAIPQIDVFAEEGYTKEEWKMIRETRKICSLPQLAITATAVRLPIFRSHCESVNIEMEREVSLSRVTSCLASAPGVVVLDNPEQQEYPMPLFTSGEDPVFVGRIRRDTSLPHGINLWLVGDQIRKGAALNALQIAERWAERR